MNFNELKELLNQFSASTIGELRLKTADIEIELKKHDHQIPPVAAAVPPADPAPVLPTTLQTNDKAPHTTETSLTPSEPLHIVKSPLVGTFYRSPAPGQKEYVQVGSAVKKGDVLCIVEAMKVMNTIESDVNGIVTEILCQSGDLVEFGTPLIKIKPL